MTEVNKEIRKIARFNGVFLWEIANKLGVSENTIIRWLRVELDKEKKQKIINAIQEIHFEKLGNI